MTSNQTPQLSPLTKEHASAVKAFCDQWIGTNYYSVSEVEGLIDASIKNDVGASFGAWVGDELAAIRLTLAPGKWSDIIKRGLTPNSWPCEMKDMAYFKSLFVAGDYQAKGLGRSLSEKSINALKEMGTKAVLCHSWLESPGNSSQKYLLKMGFEEKARHEKFWFPIDYECTRCAPERCICTAAEMVLELES